MKKQHKIKKIESFSNISTSDADMISEDEKIFMRRGLNNPEEKDSLDTDYPQSPSNNEITS